MSTYETMRHFADSWGLLAMAVFFAGDPSFVFRPGAETSADEAAKIPLQGGLRHG